MKDWSQLIGVFDFRTNLSYMICTDSRPNRPLSIFLGDNHLSSDNPANVTLAMPDNPANGSSHTFSRPLLVRRGWVNGARHSGQGILSFCDGSAFSTKTIKLQEHLQTMFDQYLPAGSDTVEFMLPQYAAIPY
jgi:prepilin-type processing-associated H-X9-DG protein